MNKKNVARERVMQARQDKARSPGGEGVSVNAAYGLRLFENEHDDTMYSHVKMLWSSTLMQLRAGQQLQSIQEAMVGGRNEVCPPTTANDILAARPKGKTLRP